MMPGHRQREHALAGKHLRGDAAGRLELVILDRETHLAQPLTELVPRHRGRVRDEAEAVPRVTETPDRVHGPRDRLAGNVQDTVDVEQNRRHGLRVYSVGTDVPLLPVERARRPARAEELDAGRGALRRRDIRGPQRARAAACAREARPARPGDRAGRALAATKPRARDATDPRPDRRGCTPAEKETADHPDGRIPRAAPRRQAPAVRAEAAAPPASGLDVAGALVRPRIDAVHGAEDAEDEQTCNESDSEHASIIGIRYH